MGSQVLKSSVMADLFKEKRKDISPKMETFGKKKDRREVVVVSDDEVEVSVAKGGSCVRCSLGSQTTKIALKNQQLRSKKRRN